jgi:hypothetical protein
VVREKWAPRLLGASTDAVGGDSIEDIAYLTGEELLACCPGLKLGTARRLLAELKVSEGQENTVQYRASCRKAVVLSFLYNFTAL